MAAAVDFGESAEQVGGGVTFEMSGIEESCAELVGFVFAVPGVGALEGWYADSC